MRGPGPGQEARDAKVQIGEAGSDFWALML
jgi:hypothetical protein